MKLPALVSREDIISLEKKYVWPPYTSSELHETRQPLVIVSAEGDYLEDANGKRYIDGVSSWWSRTLGHNPPRLKAAMHRQLEELIHVAAGGMTHAPVALLASELAQVAPPGLIRTHFSDNGSTAVEVAVKIAFQYWQQNGRPGRHRFIALSGAYHGDTLGAASLASIEEFNRVYGPLLFEIVRPPDISAGWDKVLSGIEHQLLTRQDEIAGVVIEPLIQGASGMQIHSPEVVARLRELTQRVDTFLIADEVFTGYGRTGTMWAVDQARVTPDLMCLGKGFTAGMLPMAATLATGRVYDGFRGGDERALMHGHTFCGHALGAAVAREVLAIYREEPILEGVAKRAETVARFFHERIARLPGVRRVRTLGSVGAADLGDSGYRGRVGPKVYEAALQLGAYLRPLGDTVYIAPPLNVDERVLDTLLETLEAAIIAATH